MELPKHECNRCGHKWVPRTEKEPVKCPKCGNPYWNKERKMKAKENDAKGV